MEITSGYTKEFSAQLPQWYRREENTDQIRGWDELMEQKDTLGLLTRLQPVPFYRYLLRYLIAAHSADLKTVAKGNHIDCTAADWEEVYAQSTFREIEENPKRKPLLKELALLVMGDFAGNGCAPGGTKEAVYGSFTEDVQWNLDAVRKAISAKTIQDGKFFVLAVGLNMSLEDTELFLRKVLLRAGLDMQEPEEMLLYLALKYVRGDKREFIRESLKKLKTLKPKKPEQPSPTGTTQYRAMAEAAVSAVERQHMIFDWKSPEFLTFLAEYKGLQSKQRRRGGTERFLELVARFKAICGAEIADQSVAKYAELEYAEGQLQVFFQPGTTLTIPEGTVFTGKSRSKPYECAATKTVTAQLPPLAEVVIPVNCRAENGGETPAHTAFTCGLECLTEIKNHSKFKPNKATGQVAGKLFARCQWGSHIPAGTVFTAGETEYVSTGEVKAEPFAMVPVRALRPNEDIPRDILTRTQKSFPTAENITAIAHGKMACHREDELEKKKSQEQDDACPDYRLCGYLYAPAEGTNFFGNSGGKGRTANALIGIHGDDAVSGDYAAALGRILEGTALTPTRFTLLRKQPGTAVKRNEVMTMAFLIEMYNAEFRWEKANIDFDENWTESCWELISGVLQRVNEALRACSFHEVYLPNPYDCLLVYLFTCCEPLSAFRNLWGIYLDDKGVSK